MKKLLASRLLARRSFSGGGSLLASGFLLLASLVLPSAASAAGLLQGENQTNLYSTPIERAGGAGSAGNVRPWKITLGGGVVNMPDYLGSDDTETRFLPLVDIEYNQTYFLSSRRGLGAYVFRDNRFAWALMLNADWGRDEGDNPRLRGLGDLDITPQLGTEMSWRALPWLTFTADAYQALDGGGHDGLWGNIGFSGRWPVAKNFSLRADTGIRWASDSYMGNVFGVSAAQSARSGLARYNPDSGVMAWQAGAALDFNLTPNWFVSPTVRYTGLLNGAADSPITQDDGQVFGGLFFGYRY